MKFRDIPQFTRMGSYAVNIPWPYLEEQLAHYAESGLDLDPDFQRAHVWTEDKQVAYVEYILRGGKSSRIIYFNCKGWMRSFDGLVILVDGKQRLEAVRRFLNNEIKAFGYKLSEFEDDLPGMCGPDFIFHVNDLNTRAEVLQWYIDLNSGGVVHTEEEINKVKELLKKEREG